MKPDFDDSHGLVARYLRLGLALGRHIDGLVDAYYGPSSLSRKVDGEPLQSPRRLEADARSLIAGLDSGETLDDVSEPGTPPGSSASARRRAWLRAQVVGLLTTARKLAGDSIDYPDEVEACYGVRPTFVSEDQFADAQRRLDELIPGSGSLRERYIAWRETHAVDPEVLLNAIESLVEDWRSRTVALVGLPDGERVRFELVSSEPWAGFNYYLGDLSSRVAVNTDLPVLSPSLAQLVAHESYPGHHTE
ncbi:MAG TPA: hypothetical protein VEJ87_11025, partial [Acidimicrobiales bacterium]|nr:hypothetical protein [Acidimicrobiales bacterium]